MNWQESCQLSWKVAKMRQRMKENKSQRNQSKTKVNVSACIAEMKWNEMNSNEVKCNEMKWNERDEMKRNEMKRAKMKLKGAKWNEKKVGIENEKSFKKNKWKQS